MNLPTELLISLCISFALLKAPIIGKYVAIIGTLIHEVGHAIIAILTFGKVKKIKLFANSSGEAWSSSRFWLGRILTNLAGYPATGAASYLFMYFVKQQQYKYILIFLTAVFLFSLVFWVRNIYGILYTATFLNVLYFIIKSGNALLVKYTMLLIASIIFVDSILSSLHIFKVSFTDYKNSGDAYNLAKATLIFPTPIWGTFFLLQALFFSYKGLSLFV